MKVRNKIDSLRMRNDESSNAIPAFFQVPGETRPYAYLRVLQQDFPALLDTGAHRNLCGHVGSKRLTDLGFKSHKLNYKQPPAIRTADNTVHVVSHCFYIPVHFDGMFSIIEIFSSPTLPADLVLGIPFTRSFNMGIFTPNSIWMPSPIADDDLGSFKIETLEESDEIDEELGTIETDVERQRELSADEEKRLAEVVVKFEDLGKILLGRTNVITHDIDTGDNKPSFTGTRPMSPAIEKKVEHEFLRFKELGVIEPAQSAFRNSLTMVERMKQGTV